MKYNKKNIMKTAWGFYKHQLPGFNKTFAQCLKEAWASAKANVAEAERKAANATRKFAGVVKIGWGSTAIEVNVYNGDVLGKTYSWRKELKEFGAQWCPDERMWSFTPEQAQAFCRKYA